MKIAVFTLLFTVFVAKEVFAQSNYRAVYKFDVHYDLDSVHKLANDSGVAVNDYDTLSSPAEDFFRHKLFAETIKATYNSIAYVSICTPAGQLSGEVRIEDRVRDMSGDILVKHYGSKKNMPLLLSYEKALYITRIRKGGIITPQFHQLDTAAMQIISTGEKRLIAGRNCIKYVPADTAYRDIYFWVDPLLPSYVHPASWYGLGARGGIAAVSFNDLGFTLILIELAETVEDIIPVPYSSQPITASFNPATNKIRIQMNDTRPKR